MCWWRVLPSSLLAGEQSAACRCTRAWACETHSTPTSIPAPLRFYWQCKDDKSLTPSVLKASEEKLQEERAAVALVAKIEAEGKAAVADAWAQCGGINGHPQHKVRRRAGLRPRGVCGDRSAHSRGAAGNMVSGVRTRGQPLYACCRPLHRATLTLKNLCTHPPPAQDAPWPGVICPPGFVCVRHDPFFHSCKEAPKPSPSPEPEPLAAAATASPSPSPAAEAQADTPALAAESPAPPSDAPDDKKPQADASPAPAAAANKDDHGKASTSPALGDANIIQSPAPEEAQAAAAASPAPAAEPADAPPATAANATDAAAEADAAEALAALAAAAPVDDSPAPLIDDGVQDPEAESAAVAALNAPAPPAAEPAAPNATQPAPADSNEPPRLLNGTAPTAAAAEAAPVELGLTFDGVSVPDFKAKYAAASLGAVASLAGVEPAAVAESIKAGGGARRLLRRILLQAAPGGVAVT